MSKQSPSSPQSTPGHAKPLPGEQPDETVNEEQPLGWDQAPTEQDPDRPERHPRTGGKGGTPDQELNLEDAQSGQTKRNTDDG